MKESDLYPAVKAYFEAQGFLVRAEVRDIDAVAQKEDLLVGIELKRGLTLELVTQGALRQKTCDLVYLAVPKPKRVVRDRAMGNLLYLLRRLELGLLYVDVEKETVLEVLLPSFYDLNAGRRAKVKEKARILKEVSRRSFDGNQGGSRGKKLLTAYREDALRTVALLQLVDTVAPKDLKVRGIKPTLLRDNHYQWFAKVGHGKYALNPKVRPEAEYTALITHFTQEYEGKMDKESVES